MFTSIPNLGVSDIISFWNLYCFISSYAHSSWVLLLHHESTVSYVTNIFNHSATKAFIKIESIYYIYGNSKVAHAMQPKYLCFSAS